MSPSQLEISFTSDEVSPYLKLLVAGQHLVGKTLFASGFPRPLIADVEGRLASLTGKRIPNVRITEFRQLKELKKILESEHAEELLGVRVETIVIDTIDEVARLLMKERLADTKKDNFSAEDWGWLAEQLRAMTRAYRDMDMHVVFTCHLKETTNAFTGQTFLKPALQGSFQDELANFFDITLVLRAYGVKEEDSDERVIKRYLQSYPDPMLEWVGDSYGRLPMEIEVNFEDDFERLRGYIFDSPVSQNGSEPTTDRERFGTTPEKVAQRAEKAAAKGHEPFPDDPEPKPKRQAEPEVEPQPEPAPEEPEPELQPVSEEPVDPFEDEDTADDEDEPTAETVSELTACAYCGDEITDEDIADISAIRFRDELKGKSLCPTCYGNKKKK